MYLNLSFTVSIMLGWQWEVAILERSFFISFLYLFVWYKWRFIYLEYEACERIFTINSYSSRLFFLSVVLLYMTLYLLSKGKKINYAFALGQTYLPLNCGFSAIKFGNMCCYPRSMALLAVYILFWPLIEYPPRIMFGQEQSSVDSWHTDSISKEN